MRKVIVILLVIVGLGGGGIFFALKRADEHHTAERRLWKNDAIVAITKDLQDGDHLIKRFGEVPKPMGEFDTSEPQWLTPDTIVCRDATWLAYRALTHKVDPKVYDIFIAKASDGKWYFSDYHFCKEMMVLASNGQPASLDQFKKGYRLVQFDGSSDDALNSTRNTNDETSAGNGGQHP